MNSREESLPLLAPFTNITDIQKRNNAGRWKYVALAAGLSAVGLLAVTMNGGMNTAQSRAAYKAKRLQMVKEGKMQYTTLTEEEITDLFDDFKEKFSKEYETTKEEKERYEHFQKFLSKIDDRNLKEAKNGGTAVHGLTIFSDLSISEFKNVYLGYTPPSSQILKKVNEVTVKKYTGTATSVDWTGIYTTVVNNQGALVYPRSFLPITIPSLS